jgi:formylmethanofuran dehydrogenase subunit C
LVIGAVAIASAGVLLWRQRVDVCKPGAVCAKPVVRIATAVGLIVGVILLIAGYIYVWGDLGSWIGSDMPDVWCY